MFLDPVDVSITQIILMTGLVNQQAGPSMERGMLRSQHPAPGPEPRDWTRAAVQALELRTRVG